MTPSNDDRIAYLAGEDVTSLPADELAALDDLRAGLGAPAIWEEPPGGLEEQVVMAVSQAAAAARSERAPSPSPWTRLRARLTLRRPVFALSLSFSVAAAAAVVIVLVTSSQTATPALQFAMVVQGTPLAPGAHGSAKLTKTTSGWRIELSATGLPRREGTQYYEAWLRNADGILVPVGTFNDARKVTLWSGVPVTKFRSLTVTQQVANGDPKSSGRKVLTGTIKATG
ncbi:MAG TPA: anti-sigma factor [Solirubrobacteraceae bacterium]|nr:anti-sigma factor [Solirubrobacteraceae bacterium]